MLQDPSMSPGTIEGDETDAATKSPNESNYASHPNLSDYLCIAMYWILQGLCGWQAHKERQSTIP
jgi:hypothetical protein